MMETGQSGGVGALEEETLQLSLSVPSDDLIGTVFAWEHTATTMPQAAQIALTAWENAAEIDAQYLPQGAPGQSPLDGAEGKVFVSDVTLSGSLSGMNEFNVDLQGSGAYTEV